VPRDPATTTAMSPASSPIINPRAIALTNALNRVLSDIYDHSDSAKRNQTKEQLAAANGLFNSYDKVAAKYGFKEVARRPGGRFYLRHQYLLGVLNGGRWGISDTKLEPAQGGRLVASGSSSSGLEAWLKLNK